MTLLEKKLDNLEDLYEAAGLISVARLARAMITLIGQRDELINAHVGDEDGQMREALNEEILKVLESRS